MKIIMNLQVKLINFFFKKRKKTLMNLKTNFIITLSEIILQSI